MAATAAVSSPIHQRFIDRQYGWTDHTNSQTILILCFGAGQSKLCLGAGQSKLKYTIDTSARVKVVNVVKSGALLGGGAKPIMVVLGVWLLRKT